MRHIVQTPLKYRDDKGKERIIAPGRTVPEELVDDGLIACGAIEAAGDEEPEEPAPAKPLARMNRGELDAIVAAEGVDMGDATTNAAIVAAIEAKRAGAGQA